MLRFSPLARAEWLTLLAVGLLVTASFVLLGLPWLALVTIPLTLFAMSTFRDPHRSPPAARAVAIAPSDGKVVSVHEVEDVPALGGKATCIRIYLSLFDVHVTRIPCHGRIASITHQPGKHRKALNPSSVEDNESCLMVINHSSRGHPVAAVRMIAGMVARTITPGVEVGDVLQRGQRLGLIKLGSMVELYLAESLQPNVQVRKGQRLEAGKTVIAHISSPTRQAWDPPSVKAAEEAAEQAAKKEANEAADTGTEKPKVHIVQESPAKPTSSDTETREPETASTGD